MPVSVIPYLSRVNQGRLGYQLSQLDATSSKAPFKTRNAPLEQNTTSDRSPSLLDLSRKRRTPTDHQPELAECSLGLV